ncbi:hypothetical protein [Kingella kingae]|nr:hypothetical protein [Kingella kingae]
MAFGILTRFLIALLWHFIRFLDKKFDDNDSGCERLVDELRGVSLAYANP